MSADLVSLRMLVIAADLPSHELWRKAAAMASVPIDFLAHAPGSAAVALNKNGADMCVLDDELPEDELTAVIATARALTPTPLVFVLTSQSAPRRDGIDGMLKKPTNVDEGRRIVEICVRARFPTRVLVVDDSSTMRNIVRKILSASHFTLDIHEATEGISALAQVRSRQFGIVFLDYNMPGLNGIETMSEIKRENPNVAVVLMTSTIDNAISDRAHKAGALAYLKKPFYPADIDRVLERFYGLNAPFG